MWRCKCGCQNSTATLICSSCREHISPSENDRIYRYMLLDAYKGYLNDFWNSETMLIIRESFPTKASIAETARGIAEDMQIKSWTAKAVLWIKAHIKGILIAIAIILLFSFIKNARYTPADKKFLQERHEQSIIRREEALKAAGDKLSGVIENFELPERRQTDGGFDFNGITQRKDELRQRTDEFIGKVRELMSRTEAYFKEVD